MIWEKLEKLSPREKAGLWIAGVCIVVLLAERFAADPVVKALRWFDDSVETVEEKIAYGLSVVQQDALVSKEYETVEGVISHMDSAAEAIDGMRAAIDDAARQTGLILGSVEQRDPRSSAHHETYFVEIGSFDAKLPDLLKFLRRIDAMPGLVRVASLTLDSDSVRGRVTGSMLITRVAVRGSAG